MRSSFTSLRTGILTHLAFLVISAMLLINVVMLKFAERDLIQAEVRSGRLLLRVFCEKIGPRLSQLRRKTDDMGSPLYPKEELSRILDLGGFAGVLVVDGEGLKVLGTEISVARERQAQMACRAAIRTGQWYLDFQGKTWGTIWLAQERLFVASPIRVEGRIVGAAAIWENLKPLYHRLRESQKLILIYILLNTIILVSVGFYLLSRTVVKPIYGLLRITEQFKKGEPFPQLVESPKNEIGQLFHSLNLMLKRLDENKEELESHITSLEKANEELKKAQYEIIRSEKLASIGRLATGVAHEIGNPIGIILGYLELLKEDALNKEERQDFLERIESEITRISRIIRELLDFSRPAGGEQDRISIHDLITETLTMLEPQPMISHIEIRPLLKAARDVVWADPNQLKQVFLNIIMNAADAMAQDEARDDLAHHTLTIETENEKNAIKIEFADTGPGIPKESLAQIFDPFFTTKDPGRGTGLGLSVCYRIIEEIGGKIQAESEAGKGARIIVHVPLFQLKE